MNLSTQFHYAEDLNSVRDMATLWKTLQERPEVLKAAFVNPASDAPFGMVQSVVDEVIAYLSQPIASSV